MADETRGRLREVFEAAAELPPDRRDAYLESACAGDASLRAEVEDLLRRDDVADNDFLQSPVVRPGSTAANDAALPASIGRYGVTGRLGAGGMGIVYEGTQESPQRAVAIKVIRAEMLSERLLARFRNEAEILGRLEHPGIARIYEAGMATLEAGDAKCPFFAMELVRGTPLLEHARELSTDDRLRLFAEICDAVHHAHQKGVIHRDLKPANILVTDEGQAKILDFGVARATDGDVQAVTVQTDVGQLLGTVPYMSPEQVTGDLGRLDTRSDVYSLGVVLFELLTDALPHDVRERSVVEAARFIRDEEPTRLSTVAPGLRGDLEWIVAKALEKDVERRYDSTSAFAADIRRHLADEPVLAGPPRASYRFRKFVQRNKVGVGWAVATAVLLGAGIAATIAQTVRATRAERSTGRALVVADREADRARVGVDFLIWAFGQSSRSPASDDDITLRQTLDLAAAGIGERFEGRPEAEADVRRLVGRAYWELSAYSPARTQLEVTYELMSDLYEADADAYARGLVEVLLLLQACERELGRGEAAAARWYWEAADMSQDRLSRKAPALGRAVVEMRQAVTGTAQPSSELLTDHLERVLQAYERGMAPDDTDGIYLAFVLLLVAQSTGTQLAVIEVAPVYPLPYLRAATAIADRMPAEAARGTVAMALWMEARSPAPVGEEARRVQVARRLVDMKAAMPSRFFLLDARGILGDALLQRGNDEDRDEIGRLLIHSHRAMREMGSPDAVAHTQLVYRKALALIRLAGLGLGHRWQEQAVVHLIDRPDVLDELDAGIAHETIPGVLGLISKAMLSRTGRSDRWYELAERAAERAAEMTRAAPTDPATER
ncbi:MAG: serine/threonine-protein kinase [Planctomycetota bacterium]|jgi:tRNA A-37 threonylcarbamoyl transferase component Bud32